MQRALQMIQESGDLGAARTFSKAAPLGRPVTFSVCLCRGLRAALSHVLTVRICGKMDSEFLLPSLPALGVGSCRWDSGQLKTQLPLQPSVLYPHCRRVLQRHRLARDALALCHPKNRCCGSLHFHSHLCQRKLVLCIITQLICKCSVILDFILLPFGNI